MAELDDQMNSIQADVPGVPDAHPNTQDDDLAAELLENAAPTDSENVAPDDSENAAANGSEDVGPAVPENAASDDSENGAHAKPEDDQPQNATPDTASAEQTASASPEQTASAEQTDDLCSPSSSGDTLPQSTSPTAQMPKPEDEGEPPASLRDVTRAAGSFARGRWSALQVFVQGHTPAAIVIGLTLVGLALIIVLFASHLANLPDESLVAHDAREKYAQVSYDPGAYGSDNPLALSSVQILECSRTGDTETCVARVSLAYQNDALTLSQEAALTYDHTTGNWVCSDAAPPENLMFVATSGVDTGKVINNLGLVLSKAESEMAEDNASQSLPSLYAGATATVIDERFDATKQQDVVTLHLERTAAFTAYQCDVTAHFVFRRGNGAWELASASASQKAKELSLSPIMGTWKGSFVQQDSTNAKCFGGKFNDLVITINSVDREHISGTISCLAHYHTDVEKDTDETEGDTYLSDVAFTGTGDQNASGISFNCQTPEDAKGSLLLRLEFGSPNDPSAATATVTTTYDYTSSFLFIPYDRRAVFSDSFSLQME